MQQKRPKLAEIQQSMCMNGCGKYAVLIEDNDINQDMLIMRLVIGEYLSDGYFMCDHFL